MHGPPLLLSAPLRAQEAILEDVRACITSLCHAASIVRSRAVEGEHKDLVDETTAHLLRLGVEVRGRSRASHPQEAGR